MSTPRFTVFTATHQRADTIGGVHRSLVDQTFRDFEWLVVDDGSTDGTGVLVTAWQRASDFPIEYVRQHHAGKPAAYNRALGHARGELFVVLDSDDRCAPRALGVLDELWRSIPEERRDGYAGVCCCVADQHGRRLSGPFPADTIDATDREIRYRLRIRNDRWGAMRTALLREHPYPPVGGESHLPEGIVQARWPDLPMRCTSEALLTYHQHEDGGQLTSRPPHLHPRGHALWHRTTLEHELGWFRHDPLAFLGTAANYARFSILDRVPLHRQWAALRSRPARLLWLAGLPAGAAVAAGDRWRAARATDHDGRAGP